jgi:hypothetical protein
MENIELKCIKKERRKINLEKELPTKIKTTKDCGQYNREREKK